MKDEYINNHFKYLFFLNKKHRELFNKHKNEITSKIYEGVLSRIKILYLFFGIGFILTGATTYPGIKLFFKDIHIWDNIYPRFLYNTLPLALIYLISSKIRTSHFFKIIFLTLGLLFCYHAACWIYIWPGILAGNKDLLVLIHGSNIYAFFTLIIMLSAPPLLNLLIALSIMFFFHFPLFIILLNLENSYLLNIFLNDSIASIIYAVVLAHIGYIVRLRLTVEDLDRQNATENFLGKDASKAIYEGSLSTLEDRIMVGIISQFDLRDFSRFKETYGPEISTNVLDEIHDIIHSVGQKYDVDIKKTVGDCYIITFGMLEKNHLYLEEYPENIRHALFKEGSINSIHFYKELIEKFEKILLDNKIYFPLRICGSVTYGEVRTVLRGQKGYRLEYDYDGEPLILIARLEAYTKVLSTKYGTNKSYLILSSEFLAHYEELDTRKHQVHPNEKVKNYPNIDEIQFISIDLERLNQIVS